jgi:hypothetical protein
MLQLLQEMLRIQQLETEKMQKACLLVKEKS